MTTRRPLLTFAAVQALVDAADRAPRVRLAARHDPLRNVPQGGFTLADFSYDDSGLCHGDFSNCEIHSLRLA